MTVAARTTKTTAKSFIMRHHHRRCFNQYHILRNIICSTHSSSSSSPPSASILSSSSFTSSSCCGSSSSSSSSYSSMEKKVPLTTAATNANNNAIQEEEEEAITMKLLKAARGQYIPPTSSSPSSSSSSSSQPPLKYFPLSHHHFGSIPSSTSSSTSDKEEEEKEAIPMSSPNDFHTHLCSSIQNAKDRVLLASLYIGPAIPSSKKKEEEVTKEQELLQSIENLVANEKEHVTIQIVMDAARGNRSISIPFQKEEEGKCRTTSSAKAIYQCIQRGRRRRRRRESKTRIRNDANDAKKEYPNNEAKEEEKVGGGGVYLFPVVDESIRKWLPSPLDEVAGVFHIKAYVIDDTLLLSGANLSEVYFTCRQDRYMLFVNGGGGLVDFYADLINILCSYADEYKEDKQEKESIGAAKNPGGQELENTPSTSPFSLDFSSKLSHLAGYSRSVIGENGNNAQHRQYESRDETLQRKKCDLLASLSELFDGSNDDSFVGKDDDTGNDVIAYAVPTLQLPATFLPSALHPSTKISQDQLQNGKNLLPFPSDDTVTKNLLLAALECDPKNASVRLSSAYLNPTNSLMSVLKMFGKDGCSNDNNTGAAYLLTAGLKSHGFAPTPKGKSEDGSDRGDDARKTKVPSASKGNGRGREWIPKAYAELVKEAALELAPQGGKVLLYDKECWSFHAKGLWLSFPLATRSLEHGDIGIEKPNEHISDQSTVRATIVGSGNYGARSEDWDVESNCILILNQIPTHHRLAPCCSQNLPISFVESQASANAAALNLQAKNQQSSYYSLQSLVAREWNDLCRHSLDLEMNGSHESLSLSWKGALQYIRRLL